MSFLSVPQASALKNFPVGIDDLRKDYFIKNRRSEFAEEIKSFCEFDDELTEKIVENVWTAMKKDSFLVNTMEKDVEIKKRMGELSFKSNTLEAKLDKLTEIATKTTAEMESTNNDMTKRLAQTKKDLIQQCNAFIENIQEQNEKEKKRLRQEIATLKEELAQMHNYMQAVSTSFLKLAGYIRGADFAEEMHAKSSFEARKREKEAEEEKQRLIEEEKQREREEQERREAEEEKEREKEREKQRKIEEKKRKEEERKREEEERRKNHEEQMRRKAIREMNEEVIKEKEEKMVANKLVIKALEEKAKSFTFRALDTSVCAVKSGRLDTDTDTTSKQAADAYRATQSAARVGTAISTPGAVWTATWTEFSPSVLLVDNLSLSYGSGVWLAEFYARQPEFFQTLFGIVGSTEGGGYPSSSPPSSGSADATTPAPFVSHASEINPTTNFALKSAGCAYSSSDGDCWQNGKRTKGNTKYKSGDVIGVEVDTDSKSCVFLRNNTVEPVVYLNMPNNVQFCARGNQEGLVIKLLSIRRVSVSSVRQLEERNAAVLVGDRKSVV